MPRRPEAVERKLHLPQTYIKLAVQSTQGARQQQVVFNEITQETVDLDIDKVLGVGFVGFVGFVGLCFCRFCGFVV